MFATLNPPGHVICEGGTSQSISSLHPLRLVHASIGHDRIVLTQFENMKLEVFEKKHRYAPSLLGAYMPAAQLA